MAILRTKFCAEQQSSQQSIKLTSMAHTADHELAYLASILDRYQEQPHLLDSHLELIVDAVIEPKLKDHIYGGKFNTQFARYFSFLYLLTKVRGYKHVGT
jgi:phosphoenolpyruvate-protein kinase (PTS system EI component)